MKVDREPLQRVLACGSQLIGDDRDFFSRVWSTDPDVYARRIRAVGFSLDGNVLDAGCGFGQWSIPLARVNRSVTAIDVSEARVDTVAHLAATLGVDNLSAIRGSIETTGFADASFDGIFSYSVIYFTDFRRSLSEFARVLRPGGSLYLCTNGLGWYLHNLVNGHNPSATFDPRAMAIATLQNSLAYYATGRRAPGAQLVTPSEVIQAELEKNGFEVLGLGAEGTLRLGSQEACRTFFQGQYLGAEGVYEVIARKGNNV